MHFSFDLWTSPNHRAFFGLVGHWIDCYGYLRTALLGMERFQGPHTGLNQAEMIWQILERYHLMYRVGYFTTDNAFNNDTALRELGHIFDAHSIPFDPIKARVRCFGHVIDLVVKAFLWGSDHHVLEASAATLEASGTSNLEILNLWRKRGALGKLHNICVWILRSPGRRDRFQDRVQHLLPHITAWTPLVGNVTCWHGDVDAIERAFEIKEGLDDFVFTAVREEQQRKKGKARGSEVASGHAESEDDPNSESITQDELTLDDWEDLKIIRSILQPLKAWSLRLQSKNTNKNRANGFIAEVIPAMDELLAHLEEAKIQYSDPEVYNPHIITSIQLAWSLLDKYYSLTDLQPALYTAVALHPDMKLKYFEDEWKSRPEWIETATSIATNLWQRDYRNHIIDSIQPSVNPPTSTPSTVLDGTLPRWKQKKQARLSMDDGRHDQFQRFQSNSDEEEDIPDLIQFWREHLDTPR